ncbi:hypothetical protein ACH5RR_003645 [Cinchona calisaya]|uniref:WAT1-related protein n=1 Tax=Cinchona calisaya TaxID=153742 RepID=A0ABD3AVD4_9GENT
MPFLTFSFLVQFFLLALVGISANQGFYILGLYYASPTFASAMQNSLPAITFIIASSMGLEQVNIARRDGLAKILRTIASVGCATMSSCGAGHGAVFACLGIAYLGLAGWFFRGLCLQELSSRSKLGVFRKEVQSLLPSSSQLLLRHMIVGAALIVVGLYLVLRGKTKEKRLENQADPRPCLPPCSSSSTKIMPYIFLKSAALSLFLPILKFNLMLANSVDNVGIDWMLIGSRGQELGILRCSRFDTGNWVTCSRGEEWEVVYSLSPHLLPSDSPFFAQVFQYSKSIRISTHEYALHLIMYRTGELAVSILT